MDTIYTMHTEDGECVEYSWTAGRAVIEDVRDEFGESICLPNYEIAALAAMIEEVVL